MRDQLMIHFFEVVSINQNGYDDNKLKVTKVHYITKKKN